jgi:CRISPR-associated protein Cmr3
MTTWWTFDPLDTLFFREPAPYHAGETGVLAPETHFPPFVSTLQGAIRFSLAQEMGWDPSRPDDWPRELGGPADPALHPDIPEGWDHLGSLKLSGPFLERKGEPLFPAPLFLFGKQNRDGDWHVRRMVPGAPVDCDLDKEVRLLELKQPGDGKVWENVWITRSGLRRVLAGELPASRGDLFASSDLWKSERRLGIGRDLEKQRVKEGHLFTAHHIRPVSGLRIRVGVDGSPVQESERRTFGLPIGGEGRFTLVTVTPDGASPLPPAPQLHPGSDGRLRFIVLLLTHALPDPSGTLIRQGPPGVPGQLVSAAIGKPLRMSGWDLRNGRSRPLLPLIPAGSCWFYEADAGQAEKVLSLHGVRIGQMTSYGLGHIVIGIWNEEA